MAPRPRARPPDRLRLPPTALHSPVMTRRLQVQQEDRATTGQLRHRSWWTGAEARVLVDDYDLIATAGGNPLLTLLPLLAQSQDIGLHVIIARRMGGAA